MAPISASITSRSSSRRRSRCSPRSARGRARIEIGTAVIDMRYENPFYMAEDAGAADLIAGGRLQLGISRGSPEQVIDGYRHFGHEPAEGEDDGAMARRTAETFLTLLRGEGFAEPNPRPMFPNPPGLLRIEPHSPGLRERIWWGAATNATAAWAAQLGMHMMTSTLKFDESGQPLHVQQAEQIAAFREAWRAAGQRGRGPRVGQPQHLPARRRSRPPIFRPQPFRVGPDRLPGRADARRVRSDLCGRAGGLVAQLAQDTAMAAADTLLLTVPNQLGVDYNAHVIESILRHIAPELGWR